nr:MAG TPA: baseplate protein [Bacteriophage sp.]
MLLTQKLPSGYNYPFMSIRMEPMKFAQVLEYEENVPKSTLEKYYFDYCLLKDEDPNIENLLLIDMEFAIYWKKAITISENLDFSSTLTCPKCGAKLPYHLTLAEVEWNKMDERALKGLEVKFGNSWYRVRMPTVGQFMKILAKYRLYKREIDVRIIKLVSLFEDSVKYQQRIENMIVNATHGDIAKLIMLEGVYLNFIKGLHVHCEHCERRYVPTIHEMEAVAKENGLPTDEPLPEEYIKKIKQFHGGVEIGLQSLVSDFFRDVYYNAAFDPAEIRAGEVRENE